jgi:hypothetical protein
MFFLNPILDVLLPVNVQNCASDHMTKRHGAVEAREAHNLDVLGSKPSVAISCLFFFPLYDNFFFSSKDVWHYIKVSLYYLVFFSLSIFPSKGLALHYQKSSDGECASYYDVTPGSVGRTNDFFASP